MQNNKDKHLRILLVDDDTDTRELYAEFLRTAGYEIVEANDGLEGLEKANQLPPDLVITGIIMPRMDGFAMAEALKKNVATAHIPLVFLSHLGREEDQKRAKELGAKDFIVRDMTPPTEVIERIKEVFSAVEYLIAIDPFDYDAAKLARDLHLNPDFLCTEKENGRLVLRLRLRDSGERRFDAELTCI
jgi:two-component system chemotaxis response regulator CheY